MHAAYEQLMSTYANDSSVLIASADCQTKSGKPGTGKALCDALKLAYFPYMLYGSDPSQLSEYQGNRDYTSLHAFVESHKGMNGEEPSNEHLPTCPVDASVTVV